jgi:hypothetical protein
MLDMLQNYTNIIYSLSGEKVPQDKHQTASGLTLLNPNVCKTKHPLPY